MRDIDEIIKEVLDELGIDIPSDELEDINFDSIQFISMIISLEEKLDITIEDIYLNQESFLSIDGIKNTLNKILDI